MRDPLPASPALHLRAFPRLVPSPGSAPARCPPGRAGSPRSACVVRGPPPLRFCRRRRRCRLPAGKCGKEELRATAAVAAMGVSEAGTGGAKARRAPRFSRPLRPLCSLNPLSRDADPLRPHVTPNPHMTRPPQTECPHAQPSPGICWGAPFSGPHPLGAPCPSRRAHLSLPPGCVIFLASPRPPHSPWGISPPPRPQGSPITRLHRPRGFPHSRPTLAWREAGHPAKVTQGVTGSQTPTQASRIPGRCASHYWDSQRS